VRISTTRSNSQMARMDLESSGTFSQCEEERDIGLQLYPGDFSLLDGESLEWIDEFESSFRR